MTDPTIDQAVQGQQSGKSVAQILREAFEDATAKIEPKDIQLYGYGEPTSELHIELRVVDDLEEIREALHDTVSKKGQRPTQKAIDVALDSLVFACVGSYALIGGERHDLPPLGLGLYDELFPPDESSQARPTNDRQAAYLLFKGKTLPIVRAYMAYDQYVQTGGREAEELALGE